MNIRKSIIRVFCANFFQLITSVIVGFFIPAVLSVENYAVLRTYVLYTTYVGVTHLGFTDGIYIKYGGKGLKEVDLHQIKAEHTFLIIEQVIVSCIIIALGGFGQSWLWVLIGLSILPINGYSFFKMFYQATGEFEIYTKFAYAYIGSYLCLNTFFAIILRSDVYWVYCLANILANVVVFVILEKNFLRKTKGIKAKYTPKLVDNIKIGVFVLVGNLIVTMFYAIDQWFVKGTMTDADFAYYAFAVSMMNLITILVNAISVTFYNFLALKPEKNKIIEIKTFLILLGPYASAAYFVLAGIIKIGLPKYIPALDIISVSFSAFPYIIVINALYVNLYKVNKIEKKYVKDLVIVLVIAVLLNCVAVLTRKDVYSIAMATTVSFVIWFFYCMRRFRFLAVNKKELIYLVFSMGLFLVCGHSMQWLAGGIVYVLGVFGVSIVLFRRLLLKQFEGIIKKVKG